MTKFYLSKSLLILYFLLTLPVCVYFYSKHHASNGINLSCSSKGILEVNGYNLQFVSSYRFNTNGKGATSVTGKIINTEGLIEKVGLQVYFDYTFESGMLMLKTTHIVKQVENTASDDIIKKVFPSVYYRINSEHKVAIFKMGSGYRFDFNTYPANYCY